MHQKQEKALETNLSGVKCIIGVAAGKGGVGKSTVSVNIAVALSRAGFQVGILDADLYGPSIRKMLPETRLPTQNSENAERIVPALCGEIKVISMAFFRKEKEAMVVRAPIANGAIQQFLHSVDWGELDYLIIDFPPGTGDIQLTLLQQTTLTGALIVTTPQEVALLDVRKAMQMFTELQIPIIGVVENMSYFKDPSGGLHYPLGRGGGRRLAEEWGVPLLGEIPLDPVLSSCGDKGESIFTSASSSGGAKTLEKIADGLQEHVNAMRYEEGKYLKNFELFWKSKDG